MVGQPNKIVTEKDRMGQASVAKVEYEARWIDRFGVCRVAKGKTQAEADAWADWFHRCSLQGGREDTWQ